MTNLSIVLFLAWSLPALAQGLRSPTSSAGASVHRQLLSDHHYYYYNYYHKKHHHPGKGGAKSPKSPKSYQKNCMFARCLPFRDTVFGN
jgi:hypothetical protein